jgi:hypothetical protein
MDLFRLIPDEPNAVGLIRVGPWWDILHWIVQATTVLMLEMAFRVNHMPEEADSILEGCKKGIRWLHALGEDNMSASRAWSLCFPMLRETIKKIGRDVSDLPQTQPGKTSSTSTAQPNVAMAEFPTSTFASTIYPTATLATSMYPTIPSSQAFAMYDPIMQYDQYFPPEFEMNDGVQFQQPIDAEIEFMSSAYHQDQSPPGGGSVPRTMS